jgi:hypothetical protein
MSLVVELTLGVFGFFIGIIGPRLPTVLMTRTKGFNKHFPPHPDPIPLSPYLTQRILHLRKFFHGSLLLASVILLFGYFSLRWGSGPFGFGLWIGAGWFMLSRLQLLALGDKGPWTMDIAEELQLMKNSIESNPCCSFPAISWHLQCVKCDACGNVLKRIGRPDLGRKRSDGFLLGNLRLLLTDGYPMVQLTGEFEEE